MEQTETIVHAHMYYVPPKCPSHILVSIPCWCSAALRDREELVLVVLVALPHLELVVRAEVAVDEVEAEVAKGLLLNRELVALELERLATLLAKRAARVELGLLAVGGVPAVGRATVWRQ